MRYRRVNIWEVAAVAATLALLAVIAWLPEAALGVAAIGGLAALGAAAWLWGVDSREATDRDPFRPR